MEMKRISNDNSVGCARNSQSYWGQYYHGSSSAQKVLAVRPRLKLNPLRRPNDSGSVWRLRRRFFEDKEELDISDYHEIDAWPVHQQYIWDAKNPKASMVVIVSSYDDT